MKICRIMLLMAGLCGIAQAAVTINVNQTGSDIVWDWSGSLDITGATQGGLFGGFGAWVRPANVEFPLYSAGNTYSYSITGPGYGAIGNGTAYNFFTSTSGNTSFGVSGSGSQVWLAESYVSGSSITGTNVLANKTLADIGLNSGNYTWTVTGSGDTITLNVIPEPATALSLVIGGGLLGLIRRFYGRA